MVGRGQGGVKPHKGAFLEQSGGGKLSYWLAKLQGKPKEQMLDPPAKSPSLQVTWGLRAIGGFGKND